MQKNDPRYTAYVAVLRRHLRPAMGCTEPIAIAYASAVCRCALGCLPETVEVQVSGNILKNAKSVTVPNTNGKKGIDAACAAGIIAGDAQKELEVIASVTDAQRAELDRYLQEKHITVGLMPEARVFDIRVIAILQRTHRGNAHRRQAYQRCTGRVGWMRAAKLYFK